MMKTKWSFMILAAAMLAATSVYAASACSDVMMSQSVRLTPRQKEMTSWRMTPNKRQAKDYLSLTIPSQSGKVFKTSVKREREMMDFALSVKKEVLVNDIAAIGMEFFPAIGVKSKFLELPADYGSHKTPLVKISNIGADGILKGTLALPVSGRFGRETTMKWATTDLYSVYYKDASGKQISLIDHAASKNVITAQEIEIPLIKDQEIEILYDRHGSAGPYGFPEGRIIRFTWDGT